MVILFVSEDISEKENLMTNSNRLPLLLFSSKCLYFIVRNIITKGKRKSYYEQC